MQKLKLGVDKKYSISLCMIARNEAKNLPFLWASVKRIVDEWIVIDTGSTDGTVAMARRMGATVIEAGEQFREALTPDQIKFMNEWGCPVKEGDSVFHFGRARTESFKHATKDFILWLDADDILENSTKLQFLIDENLDPKKQLGVNLIYRYDHDENGVDIVKHMRERIVPNNGKFAWHGRIHEILVPTVETRYLSVKQEDACVFHNVDPRRREESFDRNLKALLLDFWEQHQAGKPDPRTMFQLAECYMHNPKTRGLAEKLYIEFVQKSGWDEERHSAASRLVDLCLHKGDKQMALNWAFRSVQERPDFPSGYANVAQVYYALEQYAYCVNFCEQALAKQQPETFTFVNEKHNQFTPLVLLADCYARSNMHKKALEYAEQALRFDPKNQYILNLGRSCMRAMKEEDIAQSFKKIADFLAEERELAKMIDLIRAIPWSHSEDPRLLGMQEDIIEQVEKVAEEDVKDQQVEVKNLNETLPHLGYLDRQLSAHGFKTVLLLSSENNTAVAEWLRGKGYEVWTEAPKAMKFDAVVSFGGIERLASPKTLLDIMIRFLKPTGMGILTCPKPEVKVAGQLRCYTTNQLSDVLDRFGLKLWTCIPIEKVTYAAFLAGKVTSKKARIGFVCGESIEEWGPLSIYSGIGGSEEATIYLSRELAAVGHDVTVYNACPQQVTFEGVRYQHHTTLTQRDAMDVCVLWRVPHLMEQYKINAKRFFLWLHDVPEDYWFTDERLAKIEKIFVLSQYHRSLLPKIADEKFVITSNGVACEQFDAKVERKPGRVIYTSSYDRGLEAMLEEVWPEVKAQVPDAELHVFYGWGSWDKMRTEKHHLDWKSKMLKLMMQPGVVDHGRIGQDELAKQLLQSDIFAYLCKFEEISCISVMKAQVAGCVPLTTDYAALAETNLSEYKVAGRGNDPVTIARFKQRLLELLTKPVSATDRSVISNMARTKFAWSAVAKQWSEIFGGEKS